MQRDPGSEYKGPSLLCSYGRFAISLASSWSALWSDEAPMPLRPRPYGHQDRFTRLAIGVRYDLKNIPSAWSNWPESRSQKPGSMDISVKPAEAR